MLQFYDDLPADPFNAFLYLEKQFRPASAPPTVEALNYYLHRLMIAVRELNLDVLQKWAQEDVYTPVDYSSDELDVFVSDVAKIVREMGRMNESQRHLK